MNKTNYDDWNISDRSEEKKSIDSVCFNGRKNSRFIVCSVFLLIVYGLICCYSATFLQAVEEGLPNYFYLVRQGIFVTLGLILGGMFFVLPRRVLVALCPVFVFACLIVFCANLFLKNPILCSEIAVRVVFLSDAMYLSLFFSNRQNEISELKGLFSPTVVTVLFFIAMLIQKGSFYAARFCLFSVAMFACGGVSICGILLTLGFVLVPCICWLLSDSYYVSKFVTLFVPECFAGKVSTNVLNMHTAISSGRFIGKGLGNGDFKVGLIADISGKNIVCCLCEEFGFVGFCAMIAVFALLIFCSFRSAFYLKKNDGFYSNFTVALAVMLGFQVIANLCCILGLFQDCDFFLPFFSDSANVIGTIAECALIYKMSKSCRGKQKNDIVQFGSDFDFEASYEF